MNTCTICNHAPAWMLFDVRHAAYCSHDCHRGNTSPPDWNYNLVHISGTGTPDDPALVNLVKVYQSRRFFDP